MYNRYIRDADGNYQRQIMRKEPTEAPQPSGPPQSSKPLEEPTKRVMKPNPKPPVFPVSLETGDLLVLLVLLLILTEGEEADKTALLITICAFLMVQ